MHTIPVCPVCGSTRTAHAYTGRSTRSPADPAVWHLDRCDGCDHAFLNPQPTWDELAPYYTAAYPAYRPDHGVDPAVVEAAKRTGEYRHVRIAPGMRVLDVGCGGGSFLRVAKEMGAVVAGVEPSADGAASARKQGLDVFHGALEDYAGPGDWDLVTFSHVVEHLPDPIRTLALAGKLLAPRGRVWVAVPNGACTAARKLGWRWHSTDLPFHLQHFSPRSMRLAGERAGLTVDRIYTYSLPAAVRASLIARLARWKIPGRVAKILVPGPLAERKATRDDAAGAGEAVIAELTKPGL